MADEERTLSILVKARDLASKTFAKVDKNMGRLVDKAGQATRNMGRNLERGIVLGTGAAAGAVAYAVHLAGDFQAGMQTINTVALDTPANLEKAGEGIRQIFRETGQSMEDLQAAEYDLVSAGIKLGDAQDGLSASVKLGRGAYGTTAEAVDVLTTAINSYNLKSKDGTVATETWTRVSDELAQAVADGKVKLSDIAATYAQVAPLAAQAGIGTDEIAASLGYLTAKGNSAGETLTQMSRAIIELQKPNKDLVALQAKVGKNYAKIAKEKGLSIALQQMRKDAKAAKIPFIDLFGRMEGYKYALQTTGANAEGFADELDRIHNSAGMTAKQFDERNQGFNYQLGVLKANLQDAGITIGTALLPQLTELAKEGTSWIQGHQPEIQQFARELADGLRDAVTWMRSIDWGAVAASLSAGAGFAKTLISAFLAAPPWLQQFLMAGFVANKFTGGVLGDVVGDILKSTIKGSLGITAGVVNVRGATVNGAGGMPGAAGGGSSRLGKALLGASVVTDVLSVYAVQQQVSQENTDYANEIKTGLDDSIAGKTLPELNTALTGVQQGIHDLQSNPLYALVQGDALTTLQNMEAELKAAIADKGPASTQTETAREGRKGGAFGPASADRKPTAWTPGLSPDAADGKANAAKITTAVEGMKGSVTTSIALEGQKADIAAAALRAGVEDGAFRTVAASERTEAAARQAGYTSAAASYAAAAQIVAAVKAIHISPTTITNTYNNQQRTGNSSGSRKNDMSGANR